MAPKPSKFKPNPKSRKNVALYPNSHVIDQLSDDALALKIARHSRCSACPDCAGLAPREGVTVLLDSQWDEKVSGPTGYLTMCRCGHNIGEHTAAEGVPREEFRRRGRVAIRLDELLADKDSLMNFDYKDEDIVSLRKQMRLPEEALSPLSDDGFSPEPSNFRKHSRSSSSSTQLPNKKRRLSNSQSLGASDYSSSPLSNADEEDSGSLILTTLNDVEDSDSDDEEEQPLALVNGSRAQPQAVPPRHGGKKAGGHMTVAGTAPAPQTGGTLKTGDSVAGKPKAKQEELGEDKIQRLATGVTVDTQGETVEPHNRPLKPSTLDSQAGLIKIVHLAPRHPNLPPPRQLVLLTNLKSLFQKQLPKMPREYITRTVFDKNSHCMGIVKRGLKIVGGICFRLFEQRGFAEIVFFATTTAKQSQGYGSMLMNHFKMHIKNMYPNIMHFLTYADNYAVGYFKKQGFSKDITLDRSVWAGYIKDYEGGTIMQCTMLRKVNYLEVRDMLAKQREAILTKIRQMSKSHIVYPPLPQFLNAKEGEEVIIDWQSVPGLRESGWTPEMMAASRPVSRHPHHAVMTRWLQELQEHPSSWPFLQPVDQDQVPDYYDVIKKPMDFGTMEHKLERNLYPDFESFIADANLVFDNCLLYNPEVSIYAKHALKLAKFLKDMVAEDQISLKAEA